MGCGQSEGRARVEREGRGRGVAGRRGKAARYREVMGSSVCAHARACVCVCMRSARVEEMLMKARDGLEK